MILVSWQCVGRWHGRASERRRHRRVRARLGFGVLPYRLPTVSARTCQTPTQPLPVKLRLKTKHNSTLHRVDRANPRHAARLTPSRLYRLCRRPSQVRTVAPAAVFAADMNAGWFTSLQPLGHCEDVPDCPQDKPAPAAPTTVAEQCRLGASLWGGVVDESCAQHVGEREAWRCYLGDTGYRHVAEKLFSAGGAPSSEVGRGVGVQLSTLVVLQSTQSGGTVSTLVLRHSVVLVLGYSYSVVPYSVELS